MSRCRRWSVRQAFVIRAASTGSKAPRDALPQFSSRRASGAEARSRLMARPPRRRRALVQAPGNAPDSPETVQCPPHATPPGGRPAVWPGEMFPPACGGKSLSATAQFSLRPAGGAGSCAHHCSQLTWPSPKKRCRPGVAGTWGHSSSGRVRLPNPSYRREAPVGTGRTTYGRGEIHQLLTTVIIAINHTNVEHRMVNTRRTVVISASVVPVASTRRDGHAVFR